MNQSHDLGEIIVPDVDLRIPQAPPPIFFLGGTDIDDEIRAAILRYIGEGAIISSAEHVPPPRYCIFKARGSGQISAEDYEGIKRTFQQWKSEACVFEYDPFIKQFSIRSELYFVPARIIHG